ncbi:hypothetical protein F5X99DRAFT_409045 [Biscogniauxia marginata]|nr:hypothetical protein F5X99DRAFT_409045 [Biscogniauxia marginata]
MARGSPHGSGSSEYSKYSSSTSGSSNGQYDTPISPGSDIFPSMTCSGNYIVDGQDLAGGNQQDESWFQYYDFIPSGDAGQGPFWRLKAGYTPSLEYPATINAEQSSNVPRTTGDNPGLHVCLKEFCTASPFKRKADLERHYRHKHQSMDQKEPFYCDWKRCQRNKEPFYRLDHCRDHYRDYHCDDLVRRGSHHKEDREWWRSRNVDPKWWRCTKCLARIPIESQGFECTRCKTTCETERRNIRGYKY